MRNVELMQESIDAKELENRLRELSSHAAERIVENIINQVCWHGPVTREWLEKEVTEQEIVEHDAKEAELIRAVEENIWPDGMTISEWTDVRRKYSEPEIRA